MPRVRTKWFYLAILLSLIIHFLFWNKLEKADRLAEKPKKEEKVRIKYKEKSVDKKIVETPMKPTEKPKGKARLGAQDHATKKETRIDNNLPRPKGADPGNLGLNPNGTGTQLTEKQLKRPKKQQPKSENKKGRGKTFKPRNKYESLMPQSIELADSRAAGYQDYIDEKLEIADSIDLNTTDYRFIGYFSNLRKAFEMVWRYPSEAARRGLQGSVSVRFTILKSGKLKYAKVVDSSGYPILDDAVIEALELAAPYDPLPDGFDKDKLTITGSFRYVLTGFASAH